MIQTPVVKENDVYGDVKDLMTLSYDAVKAYDAAIKRLEDTLSKTVFQEFKNDHEHQISELSAFLQSCCQELSEEDELKTFLTQGRIFIAELFGDKAIIAAMRSNEIDTTSAYKRLLNRKDIKNDLKQILEEGYECECRHLKWMESHVDYSFI